MNAPANITASAPTYDAAWLATVPATVPDSPATETGKAFPFDQWPATTQRQWREKRERWNTGPSSVPLGWSDSDFFALVGAA